MGSNKVNPQRGGECVRDGTRKLRIEIEDKPFDSPIPSHHKASADVNYFLLRYQLKFLLQCALNITPINFSSQLQVSH